MTDAFFVPDGHRFVATPHTEGPWSSRHQHAGPPSALLAREIERALGDAPAFHVARMVVELLAPAPIAVLEVATSVLRRGRSVQRLEATLSAEGRVVARATALAIRIQSLDITGPVPVEDVPAPPEHGEPWSFPVFARGVGYARAVDVRCVRGGPGENPTTVWIRPRVALVEGEETSPLQRVMVTADSGNGVAVVLDPARYTFANADLTVYLHRPAEGEWVCLDAVTVPEPSGVGLTTTRLFDRRGWIGTALQALVITPR